jgi:hypothetical protein
MAASDLEDENDRGIYETIMDVITTAYQERMSRRPAMTDSERVMAAFVCEVATTCTDERVRLAAIRMLSMIELSMGGIKND